MSEEQSMAPVPAVIDISKLAEPATALVNRIANAIGTVYEPRRMKNVARAEIEIHHMRQEAGLEPLTDLEKRSLARLVEQEVKHQLNIENIIKGSLEYLSTESKSAEIDEDWISFFFERCRSTSNEDFQKIWSRILGTEANNPGSVSKRTLTLLGTMSRQDAELFSQLCRFAWNFNGNVTPYVDNLEENFYKQNSITFAALEHLDSIGLIKFNSLSGYSLQGSTPRLALAATHIASQRVYIVDRTTEGGNPAFMIGHCMLTAAGKEIANLAGIEQVEGFVDYCIAKWRSSGWKVDLINAHEVQ